MVSFRNRSIRSVTAYAFLNLSILVQIILKSTGPTCGNFLSYKGWKNTVYEIDTTIFHHTHRIERKSEFPHRAQLKKGGRGQEREKP